MSTSLKRRTGGRISWDKFGRAIVDKVLAGLDEWCRERTRYGITLAQCYSENMQGSLFSLAYGMYRWGIGGMTEEEINKLHKMPYEYYEKYNKMLKEKIMERLTELSTQNGEQVT